MRRLSDLPPRGWLLAAAGILAVLVAGFFWLRESSLVAVNNVSITGASGPDAPRIESALRSVARDMTTLHVEQEELEQAVEGFPTVADLRLETDFPHGLRIEVIEREPVAIIAQGDHKMPVLAGGTVLRGATAPDDLPQIDEERPENVLRLLGAAPRPLLRRADRAFSGPKGLTVRMAEGPVIYFGGPQNLEAKWAAAARVLADPTAEGATYVDVRVPQRTAAGGLAPIDEETDEDVAPGVTTGALAPGAAAPPDPTAGTDPATEGTDPATPGATPGPDPTTGAAATPDPVP
jgi:cell division protein FtsQ